MILETCAACADCPILLEMQMQALNEILRVVQIKSTCLCGWQCSFSFRPILIMNSVCIAQILMHLILQKWRGLRRVPPAASITFKTTNRRNSNEIILGIAHANSQDACFALLAHISHWKIDSKCTVSCQVFCPRSLADVLPLIFSERVTEPIHGKAYSRRHSNNQSSST